MVQGELFREDNGYGGKLASQKSFLSKYQITLQLDKILLLFIAFIFAFTLSHSFGVERGKRLMEKKIESLIPSQIQTVPHGEVSDHPREIIDSETVLMVNQPTMSKQVTSPPSMPPESSPTVEGPVAGLTLPSVLAVPTQKELKQMGNFTVQLVTYDNENLANKEINRLKSKGYEGFIISSGRFYQVCANYFDSKSKARSQLAEFKESGRYPDAYVRPVLR